MGRSGTGVGQLRIIAGRWRGRRLPVAQAPGLRPTGDRIRETLFNWLATDLPGARCLDLFAGSGALGLEALSRGAAAVDFVDSNRAVAAQLRRQLAALGAGDEARVHGCEAASFLRQHTGAADGYDIVFLDPPFEAGALDAICAQLAATALLADPAQVYLEHAAEQTVAPPAHWQCRREKRAGEVRYALYGT